MTPQQQARVDNLNNEINKLECKHDRTETRFRLASNGGKMFKPQCLRCGEVIGNKWLPHSEVQNIEKTLPIDDEFRRFNVELKSELQKELRAIIAGVEREEFFDEYDDYLKSPEWRHRRILVIDRCNGLCEGCRERKVEEVHHLTYKHYRNEFLFELVGLCNECHSRIHPDKE